MTQEMDEVEQVGGLEGAMLERKQFFASSNILGRPKSVAADLNKTDQQKKKTADKDQKGTIVIKLTNYKVNKGISDAVFKEK